ncbi:MAG: uroporphyrinogen-III synthase [Alphaproteobacteria bacterium]|nr:uroporphyrinogen-III synthase [Alphaproteobacteria bacterium]
MACRTPRRRGGRRTPGQRCRRGAAPARRLVTIGPIGVTAARPLILVTRPAEEAERTAAALAARGYDPLVEPLLSIETLPEASQVLGDLAGVSALVFTSVNGVRAFASTCHRRDLPVYAVGPTTVAAAREAGFAAVETAGGDVEALTRLIVVERQPTQGLLLHAAGETVAGDLAGRLEAAGYHVRRVALYRARPAEALSTLARDTLAGGRLEGALFFSPRTARTFVTLIRTAGLEPHCREVVAACLSPAVADAIGGLPWRQVVVAATPTLDDAITALAAALPAGGTTERSTMADDSDKTSDTQPSPEPTIALAASDVIARFGGIRPMATKMGISFSTVQGWKERNQIPANRHREIQALADRLGISLAPGAAPAAASSEATAAPDRVASPDDPPPAPQPLPPRPQPSTMNNDPPPPIPPRLPPQEPPAARTGLGVAGVAMVSIVVVALALAGAYVARPYWQGATAASGPADTGDLAQRLGKLEKDVAARPATSAAAAPDPKLAQDFAALTKKTTDLEAALTKRAGDLDAALASARRDGAQAASAAADQAKALAARLEALEKGFDPQGFVALRNGLNDLGGRIDALGKRIDQAEKAASAARAQGLADAGLALAVAQLRRAVDGGLGFSAELAACRALAGGDAKVAASLDALAPLSAGGVATRAALGDDYPDTAAAISRAALQRSETGWVRTVIDRLDSLVTIRPVGADVAGETPRARAARAEALLARNDLAGAVKALGGLDGRPADAAKPWLDRARARLSAEAALAALDAQAMAHLAAKPGAAP